MTDLNSERAERSRKRLQAIADRLEAIDEGDVRSVVFLPDGTHKILGRGLPNQLDEHFDDDAASASGSSFEDFLHEEGIHDEVQEAATEKVVDMVSAERFVKLLRESADFIDNEVVADCGDIAGNSHPTLALIPPRLREAATRIERARITANESNSPLSRNPTHVRTSNALFRIRQILDGKDDA